MDKFFNLKEYAILIDRKNVKDLVLQVTSVRKFLINLDFAGFFRVLVLNVQSITV